MRNRFRVRNLMVQLLPEEFEQAQYCRWPSLGCQWIFSRCPWYTCHWLTPRGCWPFITDYCGPLTPDPCGPISPVVGDPGDVIQPQDLTALKQQLRQALENIEQQERIMEEQAQPQTMEEIDQLENRLNQALEELQARREELKRRGSEE